MRYQSLGQDPFAGIWAMWGSPAPPPVEPAPVLFPIVDAVPEPAPAPIDYYYDPGAEEVQPPEPAPPAPAPAPVPYVLPIVTVPTPQPPPVAPVVYQAPGPAAGAVPLPAQPVTSPPPPIPLPEPPALFPIIDAVPEPAPAPGPVVQQIPPPEPAQPKPFVSAVPIFPIIDAVPEPAPAPGPVVLPFVPAVPVPPQNTNNVLNPISQIFTEPPPHPIIYQEPGPAPAPIVPETPPPPAPILQPTVVIYSEPAPAPVIVQSPPPPPQFNQGPDAAPADQGGEMNYLFIDAQGNRKGTFALSDPQAQAIIRAGGTALDADGRIVPLSFSGGFYYLLGTAPPQVGTCSPYTPGATLTIKFADPAGNAQTIDFQGAIDAFQLLNPNAQVISCVVKSIPPGAVTPTAAQACSGYAMAPPLPTPAHVPNIPAVINLQTAPTVPPQPDPATLPAPGCVTLVVGGKQRASATASDLQAAIDGGASVLRADGSMAIIQSIRAPGWPANNYIIDGNPITAVLGQGFMPGQMDLLTQLVSAGLTIPPTLSAVSRTVGSTPKAGALPSWVPLAAGAAILYFIFKK